MRGFRKWSVERTVNALGVVALAIVLVTWGFDLYLNLVPFGHVPVVYDLALAYLAGWVFHLLVVVRPERKKLRQLKGALRSPLMLIANNGRDLIRDLEWIGTCPVLDITKSHVEKVSTAISRGISGDNYLKSRLSVARSSFQTIEPYLTLLPLELTTALQRVDLAFLNTVTGTGREQH